MEYERLTDEERQELAAEIEAAQRSGIVTVENGIIKPAGPRKRVKAEQVAQIKEKPVRWLIPGYIPRGQIALLAGDGGAGKTTLVCEIISALTNNRASFLAGAPGGSEPENVLYLNGEESISYVVRGRLRRAQADLERVFTVESTDERFREIKFGTEALESILEEVRPALAVYDPIQAFTPPKVELSKRNEMRDLMQTLVRAGGTYDMASLIVVHTNKQRGVYGRRRIADSSDLYDIARSVLIVGEADNDGLRYMAQDKNSFGPRSQTALFKLTGGVIVPAGFSTLTDRDFVQMRDSADAPRRASRAPDREEAKRVIIEQLEASGGRMKGKELAAACQAAGIANRTFERARAELVKEAEIEVLREGYQGEITIRKI